MYSIGVAVIAFAYRSGYHCSSYYLSDCVEHRRHVRVLFVATTTYTISVTVLCRLIIIYFTMYKIVAVLTFAYCSSYHCYYLSNYKLGGHRYCLWPPHYYKLGVHVHYYTSLLRILLSVYYFANRAQLANMEHRRHRYWLWPPNYFTISMKS